MKNDIPILVREEKMSKINNMEGFIRYIYSDLNDIGRFTIVDEDSVLYNNDRMTYDELRMKYVLKKNDFLPKWTVKGNTISHPDLGKGKYLINDTLFIVVMSDGRTFVQMFGEEHSFFFQISDVPEVKQRLLCAYKSLGEEAVLSLYPKKDNKVIFPARYSIFLDSRNAESLSLEDISPFFVKAEKIEIGRMAFLNPSQVASDLILDLEIIDICAIYENGLKQQIVKIVTYKEYKLLYVCEVKNNLPHGLYFSHYSNNAAKEIGLYVSGKKTGVWCTMTENGCLEKKEIF